MLLAYQAIHYTIKNSLANILNKKKELTDKAASYIASSCSKQLAGQARHQAFCKKSHKKPGFIILGKARRTSVSINFFLASW